MASRTRERYAPRTGRSCGSTVSTRGGRAVRSVVLALLLTVTITPPLSGQSPSLFVTDPGALFDTGDAVVLLGLVALHAAFLPVDGEVHGGIQDMRSGATDALAAVVEPMGRSALWFEASATSYVIGKILGEERVADVGLHLFLSLGLSNAISVGLKDLSGRARPCWGDGLDPDPNSWSLYGGASDAGRRSYPSNHATSAFTVAAVLSEELGGATPWIAYPVAGLVAWSRVHDNAHWASDVTLGAAVGIFSARLMVRHGHSVLGGLEESLLVESDADGESVRLGLQLELGGGR